MCKYSQVYLAYIFPCIDYLDFVFAVRGLVRKRGGNAVWREREWLRRRG
jgi:hypothetical protein